MTWAAYGVMGYLAHHMVCARAWHIGGAFTRQREKIENSAEFVAFSGSARLILSHLSAMMEAVENSEGVGDGRAETSLVSVAADSILIESTM